MKTSSDFGLLNQMSIPENKMNNRRFSQMRTFKQLLKKEFWEHKQIFFWLPIGFFVFFLALFLVSYTYLMSIDQLRISIIVFNVGLLDDFSLELMITGSVSAMLSLMYVMGGLHSDRLDRSILFWKSLPVPDWLTVISKLFYPLIYVPVTVTLICQLLFFVKSLLFFILTQQFSSEVISNVLFNPNIWKDFVKIAAMLPLYALFALPSVSWILMVSALCKSRVFPWAVGVPFLIEFVALIPKVMDKLGWSTFEFTYQIFVRGICSLIPGIWYFGADVTQNKIPVPGFTLENTYQQALIEYVSPGLWIGVLCSFVMIAIAIRQRRYADVI
jgi:ABC-2 type transport system permease protein